MRWLGLAAWLYAGQASADPPITNSHYAIDLYDGVAIGSVRVVGMGGAAVALAQGSAGTLINPAAPAVKATTDREMWSWDYHLDVLSSALSSDYDNSGHASTTAAGKSLVTGGLSGRAREWAGALTLTAQTAPTEPTDGRPALDAEALRIKLAFAELFPPLDLAVGVGLQTVSFVLKDGQTTLFDIRGTGFEAGAIWLPHLQSFRLGVSGETPIDGRDPQPNACAGATMTADVTSCQGYILPDHVVSPWRALAGAAYRWAPLAWNQVIRSPFRDERALTVALDAVINGGSHDGYGLDAFGRQELQRSGRHVTWSVRGGAEYEWLPGRLRLRAGSYWEPGRFDDVGGRLHVTFGTEVRVFQFQLVGLRRGKLGLTGDIASGYVNAGLSVGFWN